MTAAPSVGGAALVRCRDAEILEAGSATVRLLLDSSATQGALSAHRVKLRDGAVGANPHRHSRSSEMFYVLDGTIDLLAGDRVLEASEGDLVVIPPGLPHAFGATSGCTGELLVVVTPGIERFSFFRRFVAVMNEEGDPVSLARDQGLYDNQPADATAWLRHRSEPTTAPATKV